jgi:Tol biopolymer transport system component
MDSSTRAQPASIRRLRMGVMPTALAALGLLGGFPATSIASRIVYMAEQDIAFVNELYLVDLSAPGVTSRLNKPLLPWSSGVSRFAVSPDGSRIVFSADQDLAGDLDLYLVDLSVPGTWTRLGSLPAGWNEIFARFSPDGTRIVFTASDEYFGNIQLYLVDLADPAIATRLNPDLITNGAVSISGFAFTPDGGSVVYVAAQDQQKFELYVVDLARPGVAARLNSAGGGVGDNWEGRFRITPDGARVVYSAVGSLPGVRELQMVSLARPGVVTTLNSPIQAAGDVFDFTLSPDGRFAAYIADQDTDPVPEIFLVDLEAPGIATKINRQLHFGAGLVQFTPDSRWIVFTADQERGPGERDLYLAAVESPPEPVRLNAPLQPNVSVAQYTISPDGTRLAYLPEPIGGFVKDLMLVDLALPGTAMKVNGPLADGALDFLLPRFSPDSEEIAFLAVQSLSDSVQELFFANLSEPGVSVRLNEPLPPEGIVSPVPDSFAFLPVGAPPTAAPPSDSEEPRSSGGGAASLLTLILLLACRYRSRSEKCRFGRRRDAWHRSATR